MSPSRALSEPVFWFYVAVGLSLLVVAGLVLAVLRWGLGKDVGQAWRAYRGWLFMVPLLLVVFFLGRQAVIGFVSLLAVLAFHEFARATGLEQDRLMSGAGYVGIAALGGACLLDCYSVFMTLPVFVTALMVAVPIVRDRAQGQLRLLALAVFGFIYFGWMFGHLALLASSADAYSYLGYLLLAVELNDVAGFICGRVLGRHALRPNISPNKTWEGTFGAVVVALVLPWLVRFTLPHWDAWDCVVVGLIVGIGGQVGDLAVSVIKRDLGIKDMGSLIPGHGGVLDRIDSLVYVAPLFFHYVRCRHGLNGAT